jgi:Ca2+-binding RTX toxin-like protein
MIDGRRRGDDDSYFGGPGIDALGWSGSAPVSANLSTGVATGRGKDMLAGIENLFSEGGADTLIGNAKANVIWGLGGDDHIEGRGGNDVLNGWDGVDFLDGGPGTDRCRHGETVLNCE